MSTFEAKSKAVEAAAKALRETWGKPGSVPDIIELSEYLLCDESEEVPVVPDLTAWHAATAWTLKHEERPLKAGDVLSSDFNRAKGWIVEDKHGDRWKVSDEGMGMWFKSDGEWGHLLPCGLPLSYAPYTLVTPITLTDYDDIPRGWAFKHNGAGVGSQRRYKRMSDGQLWVIFTSGTHAPSGDQAWVRSATEFTITRPITEEN